MIRDVGPHPLYHIFDQVNKIFADRQLGSWQFLGSSQEYGSLCQFLVSIFVETVDKLQDPWVDCHQYTLIKRQGSQQHGIFDEPHREEFFDDWDALVAKDVVDLSEAFELVLSEWREKYIEESAILTEKLSILVEQLPALRMSY